MSSYNCDSAVMLKEKWIAEVSWVPMIPDIICHKDSMDIPHYNWKLLNDDTLVNEFREIVGLGKWRWINALYNAIF